MTTIRLTLLAAVLLSGCVSPPPPPPAIKPGAVNVAPVSAGLTKAQTTTQDVGARIDAALVELRAIRATLSK